LDYFRKWKSLENVQDFFCQYQDQDLALFVLEAPRGQDFGLEDYITQLFHDPVVQPGKIRTRYYVSQTVGLVNLGQVGLPYGATAR